MPKYSLKFPELFFDIEKSSVKGFASEIEAVRDGKLPFLIIESSVGGAREKIAIVASNISEEDYYWKHLDRLNISLSPEAFSHLLYKLDELIKNGEFSTPEFYEFYAVSENKILLPKSKTLRTYLRITAETSDSPSSQ